MRKLRARIIAAVMVIVGISCTISICVTVLSMNGFFEGRTIEMMVMGMAVRDVILIVLVLLLVHHNYLLRDRRMIIVSCFCRKTAVILLPPMVV